jgi:biopolymer transport protein ExbB/TolQ
MEIIDYSLIKQGGLIMWPLLALSLLAFILFIERTLY